MHFTLFDQMYKLRLKTGGEWHNDKQLTSDILGILSHSQERKRVPLEKRAQMLTTTRRSEWFQNREKLMAADERNSKNLDEVKSQT